MNTSEGKIQQAGNPKKSKEGNIEALSESNMDAALEIVPIQETTVEEDKEVKSSVRAKEGKLENLSHFLPKKHLRFVVVVIILNIFLFLFLILFILCKVRDGKSTQFCYGDPDDPVLSGPACPTKWIGYEGKCYFFSEEKGNRTFSQNFCISYNASLAVIATEAEKVFILRYMGNIGHWIGLQKTSNQTWEWANGAEFNHLLELRGEGEECAYLSTGYAIVSPCYITRYWICSQPDAYRRTYIESETERQRRRLCITEDSSYLKSVCKEKEQY